MQVRMRKHITGTRNGVEWPPVGGVVEVPDHEAADLILAGHAEEAADAPTTTEDGDGEATDAADASGAKDSDGDTATEDGDGTEALKPPAPRPRARKAPAKG